jgi:hypothetical protein
VNGQARGIRKALSRSASLSACHWHHDILSLMTSCACDDMSTCAKFSTKNNFFGMKLAPAGSAWNVLFQRRMQAKSQGLGRWPAL